MDRPASSLQTQLCSADERIFERGLHVLRRRWQTTEAAVRLTELLVELLGYSEAQALGSTEVSRRVRLTVESARLPERQSRDLACSLSQLPTAVRLATIGSLPASVRRLAYARQAPSGTAATAPIANESMATGDTIPTSMAVEPARECATVILLGTFADHEENQETLKKRDFTPLRATTMGQLFEYLDRQVCGVVVARSWWPGIPEAEREDVLRHIVSHSTFARLKFDSENLPCVGEQLHQLLQSVRCSKPEWDDFVCHDGCRLTQHDLDALERVRAVLANSHAVRLCPADIDESQACVLIGAAIKHVCERNFSGTFRLTRVDANFIPGGKSFAKLIRMIPDDDGAPLVAKLDDAARLCDEMMRFKRYAQKWDAELNPQLHFHAGSSLIIFGLVGSPEVPSRPAPTLEETLDHMFYSELWPDPYQGPCETDLRTLIARSIDKLDRLNRQPNDGGCSPKIFLKCGHFDTVSQTGLKWYIEHLSGEGNIVYKFIDIACKRAEALSKKVIVHGDVQLRNILVRDGRDPHFIDYAYCGPGHPCYDLVRLESAVLFYCFRMNSTENELAALFLDILSGNDEAAIAQSHPIFCSSRTNRLAIYTCISCRAAAIELAAAHGGTEDDYLAMKLIISCQSLFMIHLQSAVVRSQLSALGAFLQTRPSWHR